MDSANLFLGIITGILIAGWVIHRLDVAATKKQLDEIISLLKEKPRTQD